MQDFHDFEIVICENSTDDSVYQEIISLYNDNRIKCYRTGNLSMHDNWTKALLNCTGEYIYITSDKSCLLQGALKNFANGIKSTNLDVLCFGDYDRSDIRLV